MILDLTNISAAEMYSAAKKRRESRDRFVRGWESEAREAARQGYRPSHCIHGMPLWVDYDCACGYCEDGYDPRDTTLADFYEEVVWQKENAIRKANQIMKMVDNLVESNIPRDVADEAVFRVEGGRILTPADILR